MLTDLCLSALLQHSKKGREAPQHKHDESCALSKMGEENMMV